MTALWENERLTFTFYKTFSNRMPNWKPFVKEVFLFVAYLKKWWNDYFATKRQLIFNFYATFYATFFKLNNFHKRSFWFNASDELTALWPNDTLSFNFFMAFSNSIPNWITFVKEVFFLFDA